MEQGRVDASAGEVFGVETLPTVADSKQGEVIAQEADQIARHIANLISKKTQISRTQKELDQGKPRHVVPGDFLIITLKKKHLHAYADALDQYRIANEVTGSNTFQNIPELRTILDCLQAIDDPRNPLAYVSVLRSELFGFGDGDLYELKCLSLIHI